MFTFTPFPKCDIDFISKYVGKQYLDNTENENRKISPFFVNDIRITYGLTVKGVFKYIGLGIQVNNILNEKYAPNGNTYSGYSGGVRGDYNYFYPQAGTNFLSNLVLKF
jgi:iron complex outermembrane receptor protein